MNNIAGKSVDDIEVVLQSIAKLSGKVLNVYSADELLDQTKQIALPAAGVVYEGMRNTSVSGGDPQSSSRAKSAWTAEVIVSIVIAETKNQATTTDVRNRTAGLLDTVRDGMKGHRGPGGHLWEFVVEAAAEPKKGAVVWIQRWKTIVQL
jgi:hypothetical protein